MKIKDSINPKKTENLIIIEIILIFFFLYYDLFFDFIEIDIIPNLLIVLLSFYIFFTVIYYIFEKKKIKEFDFNTEFYIYSQVLISLFLGIILCVYFLSKGSKEISLFIISLIPLGSIIFIFIINKIFLFQAERFLRQLFKEDIWNKLDEQTKRDFKQAEASIRAENIPNAILNISRGLERELKLTIFQPFKMKIQENKGKKDYFKILQPFESIMDPRYRTYENFKLYLEGKRHLTFGNIPFFLLNLTDKKINNYTILFKEFSEFLRNKFKEKYKNINKISRILFNHNFFTVPGIKISDLRNEAAHPQKNIENKDLPNRSAEILSMENYLRLLKIVAFDPNLLKLIVDLK